MVKAKAGKVGRKRRVAGWVLLTLGVLVAGVWVASRWYLAFYQRALWEVSVYQGVATLTINEQEVPDAAQGLYWRPLDPKYTFWYWRGDLYGWVDKQTGWDAWVAASYWHPVGRGFGARATNVALWPVPLPLGAAGAFLLHSGIRARRRAMGNKCKACGYDLAGLAANAKCPECGKA